MNLGVLVYGSAQPSSVNVFDSSGTADNVQCNNGGPVMTVQPEDTFAQVGQSASITCLAHSAPDTPTYIWRKNGAVSPCIHVDC